MVPSATTSRALASLLVAAPAGATRVHHRHGRDVHRARLVADRLALEGDVGAGALAHGNLAVGEAILVHDQTLVVFSADESVALVGVEPDHGAAHGMPFGGRRSCGTGIRTPTSGSRDRRPTVR